MDHSRTFLISVFDEEDTSRFYVFGRFPVKFENARMPNVSVKNVEYKSKVKSHIAVPPNIQFNGFSCKASDSHLFYDLPYENLLVYVLKLVIFSDS